MNYLSPQDQNQILADVLSSNGEAPTSDLAHYHPDQFDRGWHRMAFALACKALAEGRHPRDEILPLLPDEALVELFPADPSATPDDLARIALRKRWDVLGADELLQPPRPPEYLVSGMVRTPGLVCVYGAPGDLKSMVLMDLAVAVASGKPWLAPLPEVGQGGSYRVRPSPVLWLDMDNGPNRLQERFGALCRGHLAGRPAIHAISLPRPLFDASKPDEADLLAAQIRILGAGMCVVDNLGTVSGGRDENSSQMVDVMANLRWVSEFTGATLFVIHHARKGQGFSNAREGDRLRGHSSIEASLDLALLVERQEDDLTIHSTKTRDDPVQPFVVRWTYERGRRGMLNTGRFWHISTVEPDVPDYVRIARELPMVLETFDKPPNQSTLRKYLVDEYDCADLTARRVIQWAVEHALIVEERDGDHRTAPKRYRAA